MKKTVWRSAFFILASLVFAAALTIGSFGSNIVHAATQETYYASPTGSGSTCSINAPCSLAGARDKVRTINGSMTGDIIVYLRGGFYTLTSTFALTESATIHDSGTNGYNVIYKAYPNEAPTLDGSRTITGWTLYDSAKNIYKANVGSAINTRQLYVNGVRAVRAKGGDLPGGFTKTTAGYTIPSSGTYATMASWKNKDKIEIAGVYRWRDIRCPVSTIVGTALTMNDTEDCWTNAKNLQMNAIQWIENAYELLDADSEWYYDPTGAVNGTANVVYYKPRAGESMSTASVKAPVVEQLVTGTGTLNTPLHHIQFYGITFKYATWLYPSTAHGYTPGQSGYLVRNVGVPGKENTLFNVSFSAAQNIRFERNTFTALGGGGLNFEKGSQNNTIIGNVFTDISSHGIRIGGIEAEDANPTDLRNTVKNNTIKDNFIDKVGVEFHDTIGVIAGYTENTLIEHNEISNLPYSGVSIGWGWSYTQTTAKLNKVQYNSIHDYMKVLMDGGGVYTLSRQDSSTINNNYIYNQNNIYAQIYLDQGTEYYTVTNNVIKNSYLQWLHMQPNVAPYAINNTAQYNYTDNGTQAVASGNTVNNNTVVSNGVWPAAAQTIMTNAGIEAAYADIKQNKALYKPASASSVYSGSYTAEKANDGSTSNLSGWSPLTSDPWPWWQVDLGSAFKITQIQLVTRQGLDQPATRRNFQIRASNDPTFATYTVLASQGSTSLPYQSTFTANISDTNTYRYVRAAKSISEYFFISELLVNSSGSQTPTPLLTDDFEDGNATGWIPSGGTWSVVTDGTKVYRQSNNTLGGLISKAGSTSWTNYSVTAKIKANSFDSSNYAGIGLYARYVDATHFYDFQYYKLDGTIKIQKNIGGTYTVLNSKTYPITTGTWYTFKAVVSGSTLELWVNGVLQLSATDSSLGSGQIGLDSHRADVEFDDVVVNSN